MIVAVREYGYALCQEGYVETRASVAPRRVKTKVRF